MIEDKKNVARNQMRISQARNGLGQLIWNDFIWESYLLMRLSYYVVKHHRRNHQP
jgi:hypothetical protein